MAKKSGLVPSVRKIIEICLLKATTSKTGW